MSIERLLEEHTEQDRESFTELSRELKALRLEVQGMREEFSRYKGFVGGIAFVIGGMITVAGLVIAYFK